MKVVVPAVVVHGFDKAFLLFGYSDSAFVVSPLFDYSGSASAVFLLFD